MKILIFIICLIAAISLFFNVKLLHDRQITTQPTYKVLEILDGDTFKIENGRRVRLMGINTPELGKCLSSQAKDKLSELISGKEITLTDQFSDPYGRIMANVYFEKKYINKEMLLSGLARMDYYENPSRDELKKAYSVAREKKLGIFSGVCQSIKPPSSCTIKGNVDDNTQKKNYYLVTCNNYSQVVIDLSTDDQWFCTEQEALKAGFTKSKTCN